MRQAHPLKTRASLRLVKTRASMRATAIAICGGALLAFTAGCGSDPKPPPQSAQTQPVSTTQSTGAPMDKKTDQTINVSDEIRKACGIDDSNKAPKFDYDSSQLSSNDRDVLSQVAKCLTTGPLKGRNVELVGRADPRGESEYNMNLGAERAKSAENYMAGLGVGAAQMSLTSRGALDATGTNEETWRHDRRVDINLIKQ